MPTRLGLDIFYIPSRMQNKTKLNFCGLGIEVADVVKIMCLRSEEVGPASDKETKGSQV
jgi:hypothetical protein